LFHPGVAIPSSTPVEVREPTSQFGRRAMRTELRSQLASPPDSIAGMTRRAYRTGDARKRLLRARAFLHGRIQAGGAGRNL